MEKRSMVFVLRHSDDVGLWGFIGKWILNAMKENVSVELQDTRRKLTLCVCHLYEESSQKFVSGCCKNDQWEADIWHDKITL